MNLSEIPETLGGGERVYLKLLTEEDSLALFSLVQTSRDFLKEWLPWPENMNSAAEAAHYIEPYLFQREMDNGALWGIYRKESDTLLGTVCLQWFSPEHLSGSLGYWMGEPYIKQGFAAEALFLLCDFLFNSLKINRLELSIACENKASLALAEHLGFIREGLKRDFERRNGRFQDHYSLALLALDFVYKKKRFE
ncbi:MAG: GNAT family N-acetyltransferase [Fibrobacter sp.]|jgi:RimJ/RimL family protein N-acetyltransferase|nr:GNAT family N-acetyltransferase [Fibrobacter sp.]